MSYLPTTPVSTFVLGLSLSKINGFIVLTFVVLLIVCVPVTNKSTTSTLVKVTSSLL